MAKREQVDTQLQLLSYLLGNEIYAIDVMKIRGVERMTEITAVPNFPGFVEGIINLRGEIIPIIDLGIRFGIPKKEHDKETRIILMELQDMIVGLIVDKVFEVFQIDRSEVGQMPRIGASSIENQFIKGVVEVKDKLVIILDMDRIFSDEETQILAKSV